MVKTALLSALLLFVLPLAVLADGEGEEPRAPDPEDVLDRLKDRDRSLRLSGAVDAGGVQDKAITTQLVKLLKDKDFQIRQAVIEALAERTDKADRKKAALALAARMTALEGKRAEEEEYLHVIAALHDLAHPVSIKALLDMDQDEPPESAKDRLFAVANTACPEAIDGLISAASKGRKRVMMHRQAIAALRYATGEKFGNDPDRWRLWWKDARSRFDLEAVAAAREEAKAAERRKREAKAAEAEERRAARERKREERERKRREKEEKDPPPDDDDA